MMNGSLGTLFPAAITGTEDEITAASAPPSKVLLCILIGSCPLPGLLWLVKAWLAFIECPFICFELCRESYF